MRQARLFRRIPCDSEGYLTINNESVQVAALNISKGGACLRIATNWWEHIEEDASINGTLGIEGVSFNFEGRVCWSSSKDEQVHFGVEFLTCDAQVIRDFLERSSVLEDPGPGATFNI